MKGFDERRLLYTLDMDENRYSIPLVISTGYGYDNDNDNSNSNEEKVRFPLEQIVEYK